MNKNNSTLIDSHCHIDGEQFDADREEVVRRAREAGVAAMLNVGTGDPRTDDFRRAVAVAERYENVFASVGVHPITITTTARVMCSGKSFADRSERRENSICR